MIDPAAQGKEAFESARDVGFYLLWRHSRVEGCNYHNGNIDIGEQIYRHARHGCYANNQNDQARHDDEEWILDRKTRHYCAPPALVVAGSMLLGFGSTTCPVW